MADSKNQQIWYVFFKDEIAMYREPFIARYISASHKALSFSLKELVAPNLMTWTEGLLTKTLLPQQRNSQLELWVIVGQEQQPYSQRQ